MAAAPVSRKSWLALALLVLALWGLAQGARAWHEADQAQRLQAAARPGDIVMLSSETCPFCDRARSWLDHRQIAHRECFIETDAACLAQFRAQLAAGTPTFVVRGKRVLGFDRAAILTALES
jgi:glutaredoxin